MEERFLIFEIAGFLLTIQGFMIAIAINSNLLIELFSYVLIFLYMLVIIYGAYKISESIKFVRGNKND